MGEPSEFQNKFEKAKGGDRDAIEALLREQLGGLRAFIRLKSGKVLRSRESCSDLVQTVCRSVLESLDGADCKDERTFRNWLYTVAHRRIANRVEFYTAQKRDAEREVAFGNSSNHDDGAVLAAYAALVTPSRHVEVREEVRRIEEAMDRLPDDYKDVLLLSCLQGKSHREVAELLDKSEVAMRKLLSRARARLAIELDRLR